jgi:uncharacterized protein (TIGR02284 family)
MSDQATALQKLHTTLVDLLSGYEEAVANATTITPVYRDMQSFHERQRAELATAMAAAGAAVDQSGSMMSTVQKTVVNIRAAVTGIDENALPSFIRGEQQVLSAYHDAIRDAPTTRSFLQKQRQALLEKIVELENTQPVI